MNNGYKLGLQASTAKCEAITKAGHTDDNALSRCVQFTFVTSTPSAGQAMDACLSARCDDLARAIPRLEAISAHGACVLHALAVIGGIC
jgi:hypothetical protein